MTILGDETQPGSQSGTAANAIYLTRAQAPATGALESIEGWLNAPNASYAELIFFIASDVAGVVGSLLAQSAAFYGIPDGAMGLRSALLLTQPSITSGDWYWLGAQVKHDSTYVAAETDAAIDGWAYYDAAGFGAIPSDFAGLGALVDETRYGFSATYAATGPIFVSMSSPLMVGGSGYSGVTDNMGHIVSITGGTITAATDDNFDFDLLPFQDNVEYLGLPSPELEISDGTLTATLEALIEIPTGWAEENIASLSTDPDSLNEAAIGVTLKVGNILYFDPAEIIVYDDTTFSDATTGTTLVWSRDVDTNVMTRITVINGEVVAGDGFVVPVTADAMTAISMTAIPVAAR